MVKIYNLDELAQYKDRQFCEIVEPDARRTGQFIDRRRAHDSIDERTGKGFLHHVAVGIVIDPATRIIYLNERKDGALLPAFGEHLNGREDAFDAMIRGFSEELHEDVPREKVFNTLQNCADLSYTPGFKRIENIVFSTHAYLRKEKELGPLKGYSDAGEIKPRSLEFLELADILQPYPYEFGRAIMRTAYLAIKNDRSTTDDRILTLRYNTALIVLRLNTKRNKDFPSLDERKRAQERQSHCYAPNAHPFA